MSKYEHQQKHQHAADTHMADIADMDALPFFPKYECEQICQDKLLVTWFEVDFSQARYNLDNCDNGSNACTLIAVLMSYYCATENIHNVCPHNRISDCLIQALGVAILNGNQIYNNLKRRGQLPNVNLSIPEAIECAGKVLRQSSCKEWKSMLYMQDLATSLHINLQTHLNEWAACPHSRKYNYLFIVLICDSRSVLFIFNKKDNSIALVDSHQHSTFKGAAIAIACKEDCRCLCTWFAHSLLKYHHSNPNLYELSFLYLRRK